MNMTRWPTAISWATSLVPYREDNYLLLIWRLNLNDENVKVRDNYHMHCANILAYDRQLGCIATVEILQAGSKFFRTFHRLNNPLLFFLQ